jgi:hypothetical protein
MSKYISAVDTAKEIRGALKATFPGIVFSVQTHKYTKGGTVAILWDDGPSKANVDRTVKRFEGRRFDPDTESKSQVEGELNGEKVWFDIDYIWTRRNVRVRPHEVSISHPCIP